MFQNDVRNGITEIMYETMKNYMADNRIKSLWDGLQTEFTCCGTKSHLDWKNIFYEMNKTGLPDSCCKGYPKEQNCGKDIFQENIVLSETTITTQRSTQTAKETLGYARVIYCFVESAQNHPLKTQL